MASSGPKETVGSRRLDAWLDRRELSCEGFAGRLGTKNKGLVSKWRRGLMVPGLEYALAIHRETGIPPSAWLRPVR